MEEDNTTNKAEQPAEQPAADADGYYGEEDVADGDLDLSFLDEEDDADGSKEKHTA